MKISFLDTLALFSEYPGLGGASEDARRRGASVVKHRPKRIEIEGLSTPRHPKKIMSSPAAHAADSFPDFLQRQGQVPESAHD